LLYRSTDKTRLGGSRERAAFGSRKVRGGTVTRLKATVKGGIGKGEPPVCAVEKETTNLHPLKWTVEIGK